MGNPSKARRQSLIDDKGRELADLLHERLVKIDLQSTGKPDDSRQVNGSSEDR